MTWAKLLANNGGNKIDAKKTIANIFAEEYVPRKRRRSNRLNKTTTGSPLTHYNTFLALEVADPAFAELSAYFDGCRIKRNASEYDFAGGVSETEAAALSTVQQFATDAETWIKTHHPALARADDP